MPGGSGTLPGGRGDSVGEASVQKRRRAPARDVARSSTSQLSGTSILFPLFLFGTVTVVVAGAPARVKLHVELSLLSRFLIVLCLLLATQRMPLCYVESVTNIRPRHTSIIRNTHNCFWFERKRWYVSIAGETKSHQFTLSFQPPRMTSLKTLTIFIPSLSAPNMH